MEIFLFLGVAFLLLISVTGFCYLMTKIKYALFDTCSLFCYAKNVRGFIFTDLNLTTVLEDKSYEIRPGQNYFCYNIYLNIIKFFPEKYLLRCSQLLNILFFILILTGLFFIQSEILLIHGVDPFYAKTCTLLFTLLAAVRTKLMLMVALALSDVLNLLFLILSAWIALLLSSSQTVFMVLLFGIINGLAFRNRHQDVVLFLAGLFYLLNLQVSVFSLFLYSFIFIMLNVDFLYFEFVSKSESYGRNKNFAYYLEDLGPMANREKKKKGKIFKYLYVFASYFLQSLKKIVDFYSSESLWPSVGSILIITPLSIIYLIHYHIFNGVFIYLSLYFMGLIFVFLFMRHRYISGDQKIEKLFFGGKWFYFLFLILLIPNGICFALTCWKQQFVYISMFFVFMLCYLFHQLYKLFDYYLSEFIYEENLIVFDKVPDLWRVELAGFIASLKEPVVIMGNHLLYGAACDFYNWCRNVKCVDVYRAVSDEELVELIKKYGVNYIVVTPGSPFQSVKSSLGDKTVSQMLAPLLAPVPMKSLNLMIYQVINVND